MAPITDFVLWGLAYVLNNLEYWAENIDIGILLWYWAENTDVPDPDLTSLHWC